AAMDAATAAVERLATALREAPSGSDSTVDMESFRARFVEAMEADLSTPSALAVLFDLSRAINRARDAGEDVAAPQGLLRELAGVLGLTLEEPAPETLVDAAAVAKLAASLEVACGGKDVGATVQALIERRAAARGDRDFALADRIRDEL